MNDYQTTIDNIQTALNISDSTPVEALQEYSERYAQACQEVNHRLTDCGKFLRTGNIGEALRLANTTPHLLDLCNILDFPERQEWDGICRSYHLSVAPRLMMSVIEQLNHAYDEVSPLEPLLKKHRRLALAHAPIRERLAILYQLEYKEPQNLIWSETIPTFEQKRIEEIQSLFLQYQSEKNSRGNIMELLRELETTPWRNQPQALIQKVKKWLGSYAHLHYSGQFQELGRQMEAARQTGNRETARSLLAKWRQLLQESKIQISSISEEAQAQERQITQWLKAETVKGNQYQAFQKKAVELKEALKKQDIHQDTLKELYQELTNLGIDSEQTVSDDLKFIYQQKLHQLRKKQLQFFCLIGGGLVLLIILAGITAYLLNK